MYTLGLSIAVVTALCVSAVEGQTTSVTTWHNDLGRTGANPNETTLTASNVNTSGFGKLYNLTVTGMGQIYAQPLYVPHVIIGGVAHNVLYVADMNNNLYAFDADSPTPEVLWSVNFGSPVPSNEDILDSIGILSTPVIDLNLNAIFVVSDSYTGSNAVFTLHSLDIRTGKDRVGSPVIISGSVPGTGVGSSGGTLLFNPNQNLQRPGLLELGGNIYVCFGSHADTPPYNGWIFAYSSTTLRRLGLTSTSPDGFGAAIWASGAAPSADSAGNFYFSTGNGDFAPPDYGDSVLKMSAAHGFTITNSFTPFDQMTFEDNDWDLGSTGVLVLPPGTVLLTAPMVVTASKDGHIYLLNSANLGSYTGPAGPDNVVQEFQLNFGYFGGMVFYNNILYVWGDGDVLRPYSFNGSSFSPLQYQGSPALGSYVSPSAYKNAPAMSLSANGLTSGTAILWAANSQSGTDGGDYPAILHAYDATTAAELWNSNMNTSGADYPGSWSKWTPPTIANGKVYLATFDQGVAVYGLLPPE